MSAPADPLDPTSPPADLALWSSTWHDVEDRLTALVHLAGQDASWVGSTIVAFAPLLEEAAAELVRLRTENTRLRALLTGFVENETSPCSFDHHGYCQEHNSFGDGPCLTREARDVLGLP